MFNLNPSALILIIVVVILLSWIIYLQILTRSIIQKNERLFAEVKSGDVVQILNATLKELDSVNKKLIVLDKEQKSTDKLAKDGLHKLGIIRFNPFNDTGGDQSFSLGLLNHKNDGFVVTSIHGRDGDRIYAKPVAKGDSSYNLADEEKEVIKIAINVKSEG